MNKNKVRKIAIALTTYFMAIALVYLLMDRYFSGEVSSDYLSHIRLANEGMYYSLMSVLLKTWISIFKTERSVIGLMLIIISLGFFFTALLMRKVLKMLDIEIDVLTLMPVSITFSFIGKFYLPYIYNFFYGTGNLTTQAWQNSTSLLMRIFAVCVLGNFFQIQKNYKEEINKKDLIVFTLLLTAVNYTKPNFVIAFAPMMLIGLIYDFIKTKTKNFKNAFIWGVCVLVSLIVLLYVSTCLYPSDGSSSVVFSIDRGYTYLKIRNPILNIFTNFSFPLFVFILVCINFKKLDLYSKRITFQMWLMEAIAVFEYMFFMEIGPRDGHFNFVWGPLLCTYLLFVISICILIKIKKENLINNKTYNAAIIVYYTHVCFGVLYVVLRILKVVTTYSY